MLNIETDRELRTSHVLCGRDLTPSTSNSERSTCATPRSERYLATNSPISDFATEWPATTQGFSTLPSYHRQPAGAGKEPSEEPESRPGLVSAARKFFTRVWHKKPLQPYVETSGTNHVRRRSGSGSLRAASALDRFSDPNFLDISLR